MSEQGPSRLEPNEAGERVETSRFKRALKLGSLSAKVTGGFLKERIKQRVGLSDSEGAAGALHSTAKSNMEEMVRVMGQLKGAAMKFGQLLSVDPDLIDPEFASSLATLQREAPPMPFSQLKACVEERLGRPLHEVFDIFDPRPLGAASIGQVHRATLRDGREVAVKVQYPGVKGSLSSDLKNIEALMKLGSSVLSKERVKGFMAELKEALESEVDYLAEAHSLRDFKARFEASPFPGSELIRVPAPLLELCGPELLVMEFIEGEPFHVGASRRPVEERRALMSAFIEAFVYMFHDLHLLHSDPHPGNFMLDASGQLVILDFGCVRPFAPELSDKVLQILIAHWGGSPKEQAEALFELGFGVKEREALPSDEAIAEHHRLVLAPMSRHEDFNFSTWSVHEELRAFLSEHFNFIHLSPPPALIMYLRVIAGIKGVLTQIDAEVNIREIAERCCVRRGLELPQSR